MTATRLPTVFEQHMLALINAARTDPAGIFDTLIADAATRTGTTPDITSAIRFFGVDLAALRDQLATHAPVAPLAWNSALARAAAGHSQAMIAADRQAHRLPGEASLGERVTAAGYTGWQSLSENIYAYTRSAMHGHAGFLIDWGYDADDYDGTGALRPDWQQRGDGIQDPPGHRQNLLRATFAEIGIAAIEETDPRTSVGPVVLTQNLGVRRDAPPQLLGSVIDDRNGNGRYDPGEGLGGVTVVVTGPAGSLVTETWDAGGYQLALAPGRYSVTFTGGALAAPVRLAVEMGGANVLLDARAADGTAAPVDLTGTAAPERFDGGPGADRLDGGAGNDTLYGGDGADTLIGGAGDDLIFGGATAADRRDVIYGGDGNDTAYGGAGNDEIHGGTGDDLIFGDAGADTLIGNAGNDTLSGGALSDVLFGGPGDDFLNGGFGFDLLNGGPGADRFYHLGVRDHGTDWIQDYARAEGDRLVFGGPATATAADFLVQRATTPGTGRADVAEAFVTYRPTGQVLWALVDGAAQPSIAVQVGAQVFDIV